MKLCNRSVIVSNLGNTGILQMDVIIHSAALSIKAALTARFAFLLDAAWNLICVGPDMKETFEHVQLPSEHSWNSQKHKLHDATK